MSLFIDHPFASAAADLAKHGYHVFPVRGRGKTPLIPTGFKAATTDQEIIAGWSAKWPDANIGIATGASGLVVIDVDERHGGEESLRELREKLGPIEDTRVALTGGGQHLYFKAPNGTTITSRAAAFGSSFPGIDVRGEGGYVVAPPSIHENGSTYTWEESSAPVPAALPNSWVEALLRPDDIDPHHIDGKPLEAEPTPRIPEGQRHDTLLRLGGKLRRDGLPGDAIKAALLVVNSEQCDPKLPDNEVAGIADFLGAKEPHEQLVVLDPSTTSETVAANSFISLRDLLAMPVIEQRYLVEELLPSGGSSIWVAKPKVGKSTTVQYLAHAVACGSKFLGRDCVQGLVLYVALEENQAEVADHFRALQTPEIDNIRICFPRMLQDQHTWLRENVERYAPALVIIDPVQKLVRFRDINDYACVVNGLEPITALASEKNFHVALTHHAPKEAGPEPGDSPLGSTALFGCVDTLVRMRKQGDQRMILSDQRYGENFPETIISLDPTTREVSVAGLKADVDRNMVLEGILDFLRDRGSETEPVGEPEITENVEGRTGELRAALRSLVSDGRVVRIGAGKKGDPYLYGLPAAAPAPVFGDVTP